MPAASKKTKLHPVDDQDETPTLEESVAAIDAKIRDDDEEKKPDPEPKIEMVEIPFRGFTFRVPKLMDEWDTEACLAMSQRQFVLAAKLLLGPGQWALLQSVGSKRKDINDFLVVFGNVIDKDCVE